MLAAEAIRKAAEAVGLQLNIDPGKLKCAVYVQDEEKTQGLAELKNWAADNQFPMVSGFVLCGSPFGKAEFCDLYIRQQIDAAVEEIQLYKRIVDTSANLASQVSHTLMRLTTHTQLNHLLRTTPPDMLRDHLRRYDTATEGWIAHLCKRNIAELSEGARKLFALRVHLETCEGGAGLASLEVISPIAYVASFALTASELRRRGMIYHGQSSDRSKAPSKIQLSQLFPEVEALLRDGVLKGSEDYKHYTIDNIAQEPIEKLQKILTHAGRHARGDAVLKLISSPLAAAEFLSQRCSEAGAWIHAIPANDDRLKISNKQYCVIWAVWMGLAPDDIYKGIAEDKALVCKLCKPKEGAARQPKVLLNELECSLHRVQWCRNTEAGGPVSQSTHRHNVVVQRLQQLLATASSKQAFKVWHSPDLLKEGLATRIPQNQQRKNKNKRGGSGVEDAGNAAEAEDEENNGVNGPNGKDSKRFGDIGVRALDLDQTYVLDLVISSNNTSVPGEKARASSVHNSTNKAACAVKLNKYTKQFKLSDNVKVIPAAYEVNGRPDMDWLTWLHDDFFKRCFPNPAEAGREMSKFNQIMSVCLRRAVADQYLVSLRRNHNMELFEVVRRPGSVAVLPLGHRQQ